jgi:hypothetical protein
VGANEFLVDATINKAGDLVAAGVTNGALPGFTDFDDSSNTGDAIVLRFSPGGVQQNARQFGTNGDDHALGIQVLKSGDLAVVGETSGVLTALSNAGGMDGFAIVLPNT